MITVIPHIQGTSGKRNSPAGGRIRSSCGYHHQRHQACPDTCDGRKLHPPGPHPPVRDKFSVGCAQCQTYFAEQHNTQDIGSNLPTLSSHKPRHIHLQYPAQPQQQHDHRLSPLQHFSTKLEDSSSPPLSPNHMMSRSSPPLQQQQKLASLAHEVEFELLQQHQHDLTLKRKQLEQDEQFVSQYRAQLERLRSQQDTERLRIQQQQQVLDYQKQQQVLELQRIQQFQAELDEAHRGQEAQRLLIRQQQEEIETLRSKYVDEPTPIAVRSPLLDSLIPYKELPSPIPFKELPSPHSSFSPILPEKLSHSPDPILPSPNGNKDEEVQDISSEGHSSPHRVHKRSFTDILDHGADHEVASKRRQTAF